MILDDIKKIICKIIGHNEYIIDRNVVTFNPDYPLGYPILFTIKCKRCGKIRYEGSVMPDICKIIMDIRKIDKLRGMMWPKRHLRGIRGYN